MSAPQASAGFSNTQVIKFMVVLSLICAVILSILASALAQPIEVAQELDRSKQMLIAARILTHEGYFLIEDKDGKYSPAKYQEGGFLVESSEQNIASNDEILKIYNKRIVPYLVNDKGDLSTFKKENLNPSEYLAKYRATGYYNEPWKLIYKIYPNVEGITEETPAEGWVIPVNGYGLWDAIYGYLAIKPDGDTVIGISWYDQKETPGLGANISEESWQKQFFDKKIFLESPNGTTDFKTAPLGITVVKGRVADVYGTSPKAKSAVDGMAGATLTGNGVNDAYRDVLAPYRPFLIKLNEQNSKTVTKN